ncbi:MAG: hypothetical protein M1817_000331 [Caeruleum heppii]|nr:MAG: hypothetical protein M1817_000331 [Caeruleum heppii]
MILSPSSLFSLSCLALVNVGWTLRFNFPEPDEAYIFNLNDEVWISWDAKLRRLDYPLRIECDEVTELGIRSRIVHLTHDAWYTTQNLSIYTVSRNCDFTLEVDDAVVARSGSFDIIDDPGIPPRIWRSSLSPGELRPDSEDEPTSSPSPSTTTTSRAWRTSTTATATPYWHTPSPSPSPAGSASGNSLPPGTKLGLAIGIPFAAGAFIALLLLMRQLFAKRKSASPPSAAVAQRRVSATTTEDELPEYSPPRRVVPKEGEGGDEAPPPPYVP